jgi:hypothetical protein
VGKLFDENGKIKDAAAYAERIKNFLAELNWYAEALKAAKKPG